MELFHKIYSCYYNVVRHILDKAWHSPITRQDMEDICRSYGFQESALSIIPKLTDGTWALLEEQDKHTFTSRLEHAVQPQHHTEFSADKGLPRHRQSMSRRPGIPLFPACSKGF